MYLKNNSLKHTMGIADTDLPKCPHPSRWVIADILEGDYGKSGVRWCRLCGAYQRFFSDKDSSRWFTPGIEDMTNKRSKTCPKCSEKYIYDDYGPVKECACPRPLTPEQERVIDEAESRGARLMLSMLASRFPMQCAFLRIAQDYIMAQFEEQL